LADLKAGLNLVVGAKMEGGRFRTWRHHGLQDSCQNKNGNDLASHPSLLPESS
jgi:hypothetical protein